MKRAMLMVLSTPSPISPFFPGGPTIFHNEWRNIPFHPKLRFWSKEAHCTLDRYSSNRKINFRKKSEKQNFQPLVFEQHVT